MGDDATRHWLVIADLPRAMLGKEHPYERMCAFSAAGRTTRRWCCCARVRVICSGFTKMVVGFVVAGGGCVIAWVGVYVRTAVHRYAGGFTSECVRASHGRAPSMAVRSGRTLGTKLGCWAGAKLRLHAMHAVAGRVARRTRSNAERNSIDPPVFSDLLSKNRSGCWFYASTTFLLDASTLRSAVPTTV